MGLFSRKDKTILVIDDSPTVRRTMKSTLKAHFEVELGTDGMDGLKMLMRMTPDLVLLDINMPRLDGFKVLGQIRRDPRFRELPVIVFTDQERMVDVERALSLGANDYIKKAQMEPEEVLEKINAVIHEEFSYGEFDPELEKDIYEEPLEDLHEDIEETQ